MKRFFPTIFSRIFFASIIPFIITFAVVMLIVANIISQQSDERVKNSLVFTGRYVSERFTDSLSSLTSLLKLTSMNMSAVAVDSEEGRLALEKLNRSMMDANQDVYCAWYVFAEGAVSGNKGWYARTFIRKDGDIREIPSVSNDNLNDPTISYWHLVPFETGKVYQDAGSPWDYGIGEDAQYVATIAYPITRAGKVIGTVGMDIVYKDVFKFLDDLQVPDERHMLLLNKLGQIVYSPNQADLGKTYYEIGLLPEDQADIDRAIKNNSQLLKELNSPFFEGESLVFIRPVDVPGVDEKLYLYVDTPTWVLFQDARSTLKLLMAVCLASLICMICTIILTTRNLVNPLESITEYANQIANGNFEVNSEAMESSGKPSREVVVLRESIKKMVEQLDQAHEIKLYAMRAEIERDKAEETAKLRNQFFANMSHEIRTPMNAIIGISDILLGEHLSESQYRQAMDIKISAEALLNIINDILDISKIESGNMSLVNCHFSLTRLLNNLSTISLHLARKKNLNFFLEQQGEIPEYLYGDEGRIRQILLNLLSNAVKFTDSGSVTLGVFCENSMLCFDVIDTGIGISDEDKGQIFQAFKQVNLGKTHSIDGTGLGLPISLELVTMMGGKLTVDSIYDSGSVFHLCIPLVLGDPSQVREAVADNGQAFRVSGKALIVDDNKINLSVATGFMEIYGLECDTAMSGLDALEKVQNNNYDIIFMDHMMPGMDGVETTRRIRELGGALSRTPIIALTANAVSGVRELLLSASMDDFLSKPIQKDLLKDILARWLLTDKQTTQPAAPESAAASDLFQPPKEATTLLDRARRLSELDVDAGLKMVAENIPLYEELLLDVQAGIPQWLEIISASFDSGDWKRLQIETHSAKSSFRTIGAVELAQMAEKLEHALADGNLDYCRANISLFINAMQKFASNLTTIF